jgi:hypothetical protein
MTDTHAPLTAAEAQQLLDLAARLAIHFKHAISHYERVCEYRQQAPMNRLSHEYGWAGNIPHDLRIDLGSVQLLVPVSDGGLVRKGIDRHFTVKVRQQRTSERQVGIWPLRRTVRVQLPDVMASIGVWSDGQHADNSKLTGPWWAHVREQLPVVAQELADFEAHGEQRAREIRQERYDRERAERDAAQRERIAQAERDFVR